MKEFIFGYLQELQVGYQWKKKKSPKKAYIHIHKSNHSQ